MHERAFGARDLGDLDLTDIELYRDGFPHDVFSALRCEQPVRWQPIPEDLPGEHDCGFWVLSKHEDVQAANRDTDTFSAFDGPQLSYQPGMSGSMVVSMDGREHTRLRRPVTASFNRGHVERLRPRVRELAGELLAAVDHDGFDAIGE